jgi:hypothetical protein
MNGLANNIFKFVFNQLVKQEFLSGNRSYIGGALAIMGGVSLIGEMLVAQEYDEAKMAMAWAGLALGYKIIGDAGKQEKLIEVAKTTATATSATALTHSSNTDIMKASETVHADHDQSRDSK